MLRASVRPLASVFLRDYVFDSYTKTPVLNAAFSEHSSFMAGQAESAIRVIEDVHSNLSFLATNFGIQIAYFEQQEDLNARSFQREYSEQQGVLGELHGRLTERVATPIANLLYVPPVAVAEASMPLAVLISAFQGTDAAPARLASQWERISTNLTAAVDALEAAGRHVSATTHGESFDRFREAVDDVARSGRTIAANAQLMATSVAQFPSVRLANLAALEAIQASTATITEPAARLAAEQAAVATFVSTQLQPSLELLKPPVANLGVPVIGHSGGGVLTAGSAGQGSNTVDIARIAGSPADAGAANGQWGMGNSAQQAAGAVGRGEATAVQTAGAQAPAPAVVQGGANAMQPMTAGAGTGASGASGGVPAVPSLNGAVNPAGGRRHAGTGGISTAPQVGNTVGGGTGGGAASGRSSAGLGTGPMGGLGANMGGGAAGQRLPQLPVQAREAALAREAAFKAGTGPHAAGHSGSSGPLGATGRMGEKQGGGSGRRNKNNGMVRYTKEDKGYFKRLFFGGDRGAASGKRTVRKVLTRG